MMIGLGLSAGVRRQGTPTPTPSPTAPAQIPTLTATPGDGQAVLSWTAPGDGGSAITDYTVQHKLTSSGTWLTFADGVSPVPGATVTGLANGSAYDFRAAAVNAVGTGPWSDVASATPQSAAPTMPAVENLVMHFRVEDIPAQTDNTAFAGEWTDSVSGTKISQPTSAQRPFYRASRTNGLPALEVRGTHWLTVGRPPAMINAMSNASNATGCTAFFVVSIGESTSDTFRAFWSPSDVNNGSTLIAAKTVVGSRGESRVFTNRTGYAIIVVRGSSLLKSHYFDQFNAIAPDTSTLLTPHASNAYQYGHSSGGSPDPKWGMMGDLMDFGFYNRALSLAEIAKLIKAINHKFGQPLPWAAHPYFVVVDGNSYTSGSLSWAPTMLKDKGLPHGAHSNIAISGRTTQMMIDAVDANFTGLQEELGRPVVLLANEFYNSPDANATIQKSYLAAAKAKGITRIGWLDAWDNGNIAGLTYTGRATANAAMAAAEGTLFDVLIPISTDATMGVEGACPNTPGPYGAYFKDNVGHPTQAASNYVAAFATPYFNTLVAGL